MKYLELIDSYRDEMVKDLQGLLAFDSVYNKGENGTPYGVEVQKSLDYMMELGQRDGFTTLNVDNKAGHIEVGAGQDIVGILVHLDIVPVGSGWEHDPFGKDIVDGNLYGRGTMDDKGPAMAAYYAMKALKEVAKEDPTMSLNKRVRLILGLDEEKGVWDSIPYYFTKEPVVNIGFTPDASYPVIHAEMGILIFELVKKLNKNNKPTTGNVVKSIKGGNAHNMVPDWCTTVISNEAGYDDVKTLIAAFAERTSYKISCKGRGKSLEITTEGISAHGAQPASGLNAISIMMAFLAELEIQGDEFNEFVEFYNSKIGFNVYGENIGCGFADEVSGKLLYNIGVINVDDETATLTVCVRYPVTHPGKDPVTDGGDHVYDGMREIVDSYNIGVVKIEDKKPVYFPLDSKLVTTLVEVYQKHTGDTTTAPEVTGGGTYARAGKNIIAFGPAMPGEEEREHKKNEYIEIDRLVQSAKIYAEAIFKLANEE